MDSPRLNKGVKYVYESLCVQPNATPPEAQYEAFQSIFADIMYASYPPQLIDTSLMTTYELLCYKYNIILVDLSGESVANLKKKMREYNIDPNSKVIFFNPTGTTHYIAYINGNKLNPYDFYQVKGSQGFCQTFAFFLATSDTDDFIVVDQNSKIDEDNFNKLALNTQICATKIFDILDNDLDIMEKFKEQFNSIYNNPKSRKKYGIKVGTTCEQYLHDFRWINSDLNSVRDYIYDLDLQGWPKKKPKDELWFSYNIEPEIWATMQMSKKRSLKTQKSKTNKRTKTKKTNTMTTVGAGKKKKKKQTKKKKRGGTKPYWKQKEEYKEKKEKYKEKKLMNAQKRLAAVKSMVKNPNSSSLNIGNIIPDLQETIQKKVNEIQEKEEEDYREDVQKQKADLEKRDLEEKQWEKDLLDELGIE